jgi:membrane protein
MIAGVLAMVLAAAGAFLELRSALNTIWRVPPSSIGGFRAFWFNRLRSFGLVLAIGFLLLISLAVSAALAALHEWLTTFGLLVPVVLNVFSILLSLLVSAVLFGLMFKVLPDVTLATRDVVVGALVTAAFFSAGKYLIGLYLGHTAASSSYGAAGSVVILLLWVYYSSQIVLIGAEFTRLYADRDGAPKGRNA